MPGLAACMCLTTANSYPVNDKANGVLDFGQDTIISLLLLLLTITGTVNTT